MLFLTVGIFFAIGRIENVIIGCMKQKFSIMNWLFSNATVVAFKYEYLLHFLTFSFRNIVASLVEVTAIMNVALRSKGFVPSDQLRKLGMPIKVAAILPMIFLRHVITRFNTSLGGGQRQ